MIRSDSRSLRQMASQMISGGPDTGTAMAWTLEANDCNRLWS